MIKAINILVSVLFLILSIVRAGESVDFNNLAEEKARIKADVIEAPTPTPIKPTPGQLIFANQPKQQATPAVKPEENQISTPKPAAQQPRKNRKSEHKKQLKQEEAETTSSDDRKKSKSEEKESEEPSTSAEKKNPKNNKGNKKHSDSDDSDELPKRLFRPRFRAESSAESLKISIIITISLSLLGILFI